jgi:isoquinoline 1-oxidoreductase alpha subunit
LQQLPEVSAMSTLKINGRQYEITSRPDTPLLWVLRDELGLTGTKYGCGEGLCGACTVHIDGEPTRTCITEVGSVDGKRITTIEGLSADKVGKAVQQAWIDLDVVQCGYCQSGQCMAAAALLTRQKKPTDGDINDAMSGNLCRCGTYHRIRQAVHLAATKL